MICLETFYKFRFIDFIINIKEIHSLKAHIGRCLIKSKYFLIIIQSFQIKAFMVYIFKIHNINSAKTVQSQLLYISFRSLYKNAVLSRGCTTHPRLRTACSTQSFRWEKSILKNIFKILISSIVN